MSIVIPPIAGDPNLAAVTLPPDRDIGSLWRRFVAFAIDGIILGLAGMVIAMPFFEKFSHLGLWGRLIGFCLALPYFALLNSHIGNGQTIGKRLMHVQVVNLNGTTISVGLSVARYGVFAVPYFLNGMSLPTTRTPQAIFILVSFLIFGVGGATLYLVLFNRHTRQGIHDLAVGSYVADSDKDGPLKIEPIWKMHWIIFGSLFVVISIAAGIFGNKLSRWGPFPQLLDDVAQVERMGSVQVAGVQDLTQYWSGGGKKTVLVISVTWTGKATDEQAFADQVAKLIIEHDPKVKEHDLLRVVMIRGYDLGIAHAQVSNSFEHTPAEWSTRLFGTSPPEKSVPAKL